MALTIDEYLVWSCVPVIFQVLVHCVFAYRDDHHWVRLACRVMANCDLAQRLRRCAAHGNQAKDPHESQNRQSSHNAHLPSCRSCINTRHGEAPRTVVVGNAAPSCKGTRPCSCARPPRSKTQGSGQPSIETVTALPKHPLKLRGAHESSVSHNPSSAAAHLEPRLRPERSRVRR